MFNFKNLTFINNTYPLIIFDNFLSKEDNKKIIDEAYNNKSSFKTSVVGGKPEVDATQRTNLSVSYDEIYKNRRDKSSLINILASLIKDEEFLNTIISMPYPLCDFGMINKYETQVSRYGNNSQKYKCHVDRFTNHDRFISMIYYFHEEPRRFSGGDICFTDSPIYDGELCDKTRKIESFKSVNNRLIIFGSSTPHSVLPTFSNDKFEDGRFSMNCWVGIDG